MCLVTIGNIIKSKSLLLLYITTLLHWLPCLCPPHSTSSSVSSHKKLYPFRYYEYMFDHMMPWSAKELITQTGNCKELGMNFLISSITKKSPVKLINKNLKQFSSTFSSQRQACTNAFTSIFGTMPLRYSMLRMDPSLFKDNVSVLRKQYRKLEML